jgi:hypothetical protein
MYLTRKVIAWFHRWPFKGDGKVIGEIKSPNSTFEPVINGDWTTGVYNLACRP